MNLYKKLALALLCVTAPLTACAAEPTTIEPRTDPVAGIASLMTPPAPPEQPVDRSCKDDSLFNVSPLCFDNWGLLANNNTIASNTFLDAVGVNFLRGVEGSHRAYLVDNGYIAGGILGDKQYCLMLLSDKSSEVNDSYTATVMSRYYPEILTEFNDVTLETAKYLTEIVRQRCP